MEKYKKEENKIVITKEVSEHFSREDLETKKEFFIRQLDYHEKSVISTQLEIDKIDSLLLEANKLGIN